jgi:hypothetical protein
MHGVKMQTYETETMCNKGFLVDLASKFGPVFNYTVMFLVCFYCLSK